jgi:alanyl-tRNA synthetase
MRVVADHLRAVVFSIADGQLPSNVKAGYVIRRILRRAIRYGYTFLNLQDPFMFELVPSLVEKMVNVFPEIRKQQDLIRKVIMEEEIAFLRTLALGIKKFEAYIASNPDQKNITGQFAFELFDTFGFPVDLTRIMAAEIGWDVDLDGFNKGLENQKKRSRDAASKDTEDWIIVDETVESSEFVGYDHQDCVAKIIRYRKVKENKNEFYQLVLDKTPFYAESGGQVGDRGYLQSEKSQIEILDTKKENDLTVHIVKSLPENINALFSAIFDGNKRLLTMNNHSATHLMHAALRKVLGDHVEQKGSLVNEKHLRFDFSHFSKLTDDEIWAVEKLVNEKIRENIPVIEKRNVPMDVAKKMGAMALFGEKYGDNVRVISFDPAFSIELCGGTHVPATGQIGFFKIISEGAIAAGIRRIEAVTAVKSEEYIYEQLEIVNELKNIFKSQTDVVKGVQSLLEQNNELKKQLEAFNAQKADGLKNELLGQVEKIRGINFLAKKVDLDAGGVRDLAFKIHKEIENLFLVLGNASDGKAGITIMISENLVKENDLNAGTMIREVAKEIQGGGGGQPHFATAGGKNPEGIERALLKARELVGS